MKYQLFVSVQLIRSQDNSGYMCFRRSFCPTSCPKQGQGRLSQVQCTKEPPSWQFHSHSRNKMSHGPFSHTNISKLNSNYIQNKRMVKQSYRASHLQTLQKNKCYMTERRKTSALKLVSFISPFFFHSRVKIKLILSPIYNTCQIKHPPCSCHFCSVMILVRHENNFLYT